MKTKFFLLAAAAVALASCSNDEVVEVNQGEAIRFRPLVNNVTRATEKSAFAANDEISVRANFGSNDYFNCMYKYDGSTGFKPSTSTDHYYWPSSIADEDGKRMTFYATYGATQTGDGTFSLSTFDGETDILFAKSIVTAKPSDGQTTLNFRHTLSEIDVKAKNTNSGLQVIITGVRIGYVTKTGDFACDVLTTPRIESATGTSIPHLDQAVWTRTNPTSASTAADIYEKGSFTGANILTLTGAVATAQAIPGLTPWMVIPQNLNLNQTSPAPVYTKLYATSAKGTASSPANLNCAYIALEMAINNNDTGKTPIVAKQWCYWPITESWEPGKKYTYIIDVAGGGYQPINVDDTASDELDPVLKGLEITFNACSIDVWVTDLNENDTADDDIDVAM